MTARTTLLAHAWAQAALVAVAVLLLGDLSEAWFLRIDLTRDQRNSVSALARAAVSNLDRPLTARVYFSEDLEPPYHDHRRVLLDWLDELAAWSDGRLQVRAVDPSSDPELAAEATRAGIQPVPYVYRAHDRQEARTVYMGVVFSYGERQAVVPALPSLAHLEAELVRALRDVVTPPDERRTVGWVVGHGEPDPRRLPADSPLVELRDELRTHRGLSVVDLGEPLSPDLDLVLLLAPREALPDAHRLRLDQHVLDGGALVTFVSSFQPDFQRGQVVPVDHGLGALLGTWGATPERALVIDRADNERLALPVAVPGAEGARWVQVHHPLAPTTTALDRTHPAVRDLGRLVLPFVTPLTVADPPPSGVRPEVWATSGPRSTVLDDVPSLHPAGLAQRRPDERDGPVPVVVALSGTLPTSWHRPTVPEGFERTADELRTVGRPARVVVAGSGDAAANSIDLVLSSVDWALQDPELLALARTRGARAVLEAPSPSRLLQLRMALTLGPLLLLGLLTLAVRRGLR